MKKIRTKKELLKINLFVTAIIIIANLIIFYGIDSGKNAFTQISAYVNGLLFFVYVFILSSSLKKNLIDIKKEALYINFPLHISIFLLFLLSVLVFSAICLISVNKDAANITFIFTFFMSTIAMLFPSILLTCFMFFIVPAFIIPGLSTQKRKKSDSDILLKTGFVLFLIFCFYNIFNAFKTFNNIDNQNRYKSAKLTISYQTNFLKLQDISPYAKKKMSKNKCEVPFFYTAEAIPFNNYNEADRFCRSLDARLPNYLETYHIVFNKFDTFGDKYYWTSDTDSKTPLALHFKNMSYNIEKMPAKQKAYAYCIAKSSTNYGFGNKAFFYRNKVQENKESINEMINKDFDFEALKDIVGIKDKEKQEIQYKPEQEVIINKEKKHVNFSVKEVSHDVFRDLLQAGYKYDPSLTIKKEFETNEFIFDTTIQKKTDKIRLCSFPFTDYGNLNLNQEKQIWLQSFCSPAFDLVSQTPVLKSKHEKDSYCYAYGGRVPNIPELNGILKTLGIKNTNTNYWTNNKINDYTTGSTMPVMVYYQDSRFMKVKALTQAENESAYTFCIKKPQTPSIVISNYKSRFVNTDGAYNARLKCPNCHYYEVPDVILQQ